MKQKKPFRPNSSTKELNQLNYLAHPRMKTGRWRVLMVLVVLSVGAYYFFQAIGVERTIERITQAPLGVQLEAIIYGSTFLIIYFALAMQFLPFSISFKRKQKFKTYRRLLRNLVGVSWMSLVVIGTIVNFQVSFFPDGWEAGIQTDGIKNLFTDVGTYFLIVVAIVFLVVYFYSFITIFRILKLTLAHGTVTAQFDQDAYFPGSTLKVKIKDRQSRNSQLKYRVHLSLIGGKEVRKKTSSKTTISVVRFCLHSEYQDVSPITLDKGVTFILPTDVLNITSLRTDLSAPANIQFWEIVVEEIDGYFFAGFNFDVK